MKKLTVAERRERELKFATEKYNIPYDEGKRLMNRFYRLNGAQERLLYLENDSRTCNKRSTKELSESLSRRSDKLNEDFNKYGLCLNYFGYLATICEKETTRTAIEAIYYN